MNIERERKFLLKRFPHVRGVKEIFIQQGYLVTEESGKKHLRIRIIDKEKGTLTFKNFIYAGVRKEIEHEISLDHARELYEQCDLKLEKYRYILPAPENHRIFIDVIDSGEIFAEVEYLTEDTTFIPDWCSEDITSNNKYSNINLAKKEIVKEKSILQKALDELN